MLFSLMLSPTSPQETPFSLRTSFWGSMTTRAVSLLLNSIAMLLISGYFFTCLSRKSRISLAISSPLVSRAKCPASMRWYSSVFRSRL